MSQVIIIIMEVDSQIISLFLIVHLFDGWGGSELVVDKATTLSHGFAKTQVFTLNQKSKIGIGTVTISEFGEYDGVVKGKVVLCMRSILELFYKEHDKKCF